MRRFSLPIALVVAAGLLAVTQSPARAAPNKNTVAILARTVSGGANSLEARAATALGLQVDVLTETQWRALSQADVANYRAIVLGDPTCGSVSAAAAAAETTRTWGPALTGNIVVVGTDPVYHAGRGGKKLTDKGIAFAVANERRTGAYITLSCYYHGVARNTAVPMLDGIGEFKVTGVGCYNNAHIVAQHPALDGLTDADLSNWFCSVHEAFTTWPENFDVLAIAKDIGDYTAPDGTRGTPYILARGASCGEDGLDHLHGTPAKGVVSGTVHEVAEPVIDVASADVKDEVHRINCDTVRPTEDQVDAALP